jgi:hypothetical protein
MALASTLDGAAGGFCASISNWLKAGTTSTILARSMTDLQSHEVLRFPLVSLLISHGL